MYENYDDTKEQENVVENSQYRYSSYQFAGGHIPEEPKKTPKKKSSFIKKAFACMALGLIFGLFAGTGIYAVNLFTANFSTNQTDITSTAPQIGDQSVNESDKTIEEEKNTLSNNTVENTEEATNALATKSTLTDVSGVAEAVMPTVVSITNMYTEKVDSFWGEQGEYQNEASGSGFIVGENDTELLIATNNHVVSDADTLSVQFIDGSTAEAQLKGAQSDVDLAVIAVSIKDLSEDTKSKIKVSTLGDSEDLKVGEPVIAIGNALGYGQSVTAGVISALNREVTVDDVTSELIQTDAAINPGNSGGALLNIDGEVIGINAVKYAASGVEGMGYAIPISTAQPIIDELMNRETKVKVAEEDSAYLGISGVDVTSDVAEMYSMPKGVYVAQVSEGTSAANGGIKKGDIITSFDNQTVQSMDELKSILEYYAAGTVVDIKVQQASENGYVEKTVTVMLGKKVN
ncbi:MAG: trypsin-like peptidase domain-containing protein [Lachnospiraceae bacterium]|nr:trypsin-like peptidase domain-containing protein [Lachnospiraceae bacterium]